MSNWTINNVSDQSNKIFVITGANSGIGFTAARELARKNATVVMAVRSLNKGASAKAEILKESPKANVIVMQLDLADLNSVRQFGAAFKAKFERLDVLINNAGIMMPNSRMLSAQGYEIQLATNHFGHFVLVNELLPILEASDDPRIVTVSSLVTNMKAADIYFDDLQFEQNYQKMPSYAQSKLANLMFAQDLDERLKKANSTVKSVMAHPGYTATNLQQHMGLLGTIMNALMAQKQEMGVLPILRAATAPNANGGDYFGPTKMNEYRGYPDLVNIPQIAKDKTARTKLWQQTEALTNTQFQLAQ